jgi:hypothetical protein
MPSAEPRIQLVISMSTGGAFLQDIIICCRDISVH